MERHVLEIKVKYENGKLYFWPDPAHVQRGELVSWSFEAAAPASPLQWVVYFDHSSPFPGQAQFVADTTPVDGQHAGTTSVAPAEERGDYKYGARVVDAAERVTLADDDPRLIVD
jgi:hypothetical protein